MNPRIFYLSCHTVLEYDEVKLFTELGYDVFSHGGYLDPKGHITLPRPGIDGMTYYPELVSEVVQYPRTAIPRSFFDRFDIVIVMHTPELISQNWENMKHKRVIWRTIGQSTPRIEQMLAPYRAQGLEVVRYSPKEQNLEGYIGSNALIRFYKDPDELKDWHGDDQKIVNFTQSLLGRRYFCHYDELIEAGNGLPFTIYGTGNEDLGGLNGGEVPYPIQKKIMQSSRAAFYAGTWPASYTLSFMEYWMTGTPVIAISKKLAQPDRFEHLEFYEVDELIDHGVNGFICDTHQEMNECARLLLEDHKLAQKISSAGRQKAIEVFGRLQISQQWDTFLSRP